MHLPPPSPSRPDLAQRAWLSDGDGSDPEDELQNWSSLIGIITAICGNVLIALALNVQRYAHLRLHRKKVQIRERARQALKNASTASQGQAGTGRYGAAAATNGDSDGNSNGAPYSDYDTPYSDDDLRASSETDPLTQSFRSDDSADDGDKDKAASTYLKDPYWWLGQVLITVGEMGNFLAYGFAPASIVSPLGVVALVSNCVIAPIFFNEVFRQRDFWGVIIAITGAVTVVLSAKTEETKLGPHEVWDAITTMEFEIYLGVTCGLIALLMWLSPRYGHRTILIDLGLVGLFGGYTALSTKGVSSMLSSTLLGAFTTPVTYVLVFVLLFTAIMQVRYVNKALQRFESTQVIPVQFVLFTLCVIIGSAVLYRDFERTTGEQAVKFVGGCLFTFFGVFVITSGRPRQDDEDEATLSDAEGIEETIGLAEQDRAAPPTPPQPHHNHNPARSPGSSRTPRVSFSSAIHRPLSGISDSGFPSSRVPHGPPSQKPHLLDDDDDDYYEDAHEDAPLLSNPWHDSNNNNNSSSSSSRQPTRPSPGRHTISSDSIPSAVPSSAAISDTTATTSSTGTKPIPGTTPPRISLLASSERPTTPRAPASSSRLQPHVYSPSPFSSTLSAVVGDKFSSNLDGSHGHGHGYNNSLSLAAGGGGGGGGVNHSSQTGLGSRRRATGGTASGSGLGLGLRGGLFVALPRADQGQARGSISAGAEFSSAGENGDDGNGNGNGNGGGLRGRARSLSHTLGLAGLFGGGGGSGGGTAPRRATVTRRDTTSGGSNAEIGEESGVFGGTLERARTAGDGERNGGFL